MSPARVHYAPVRSTRKRSMVERAGGILERAGLRGAIADGDLVAVKMHFGEQGNTGFVHPIF
ncbi:MAG TPA: 4Fe-4S ferredoxin, partial [Coriobacteriia bacterium]